MPVMESFCREPLLRGIFAWCRKVKVCGVVWFVASGIPVVWALEPAGGRTGDAGQKRGVNRELNQAVLQSIQALPEGGGYAVNGAAFSALRGAIRSQKGIPGILEVDMGSARPSFCSGATYLVFLGALQRLVPEALRSEELVRAFLVRGQPDGIGIWGRWNANGPGTAVLFQEADLGRNFEELEKAEPGDFLKIFWNDGVGANEKGHSVVYLGRRGEAGEEEIQFWSSNQPGGYGVKWVSRSRMRRLLFSRLERPENIRRVLEIAPSDSYLSRLNREASSWSELEKKLWGVRGEVFRARGK